MQTEAARVTASTSSAGQDQSAGETPVEEAPADLSLSRRFFDWKTLASFVVAIAILALLLSRVKIDVGATLEAIRHADPFLFLLGAVSFYMVFPVRGLRWQLMLRNSGLPPAEIPTVPRLIRIIFVSWFVNCLVPAKLGDVYRAYLLKSWERISGSKAGGTIVAERFTDLTTLLLLGGAAGLLSLRGAPPEKLAAIAGPLEGLAGLVIVAALGLVAMRLYSSWVRRIIPKRFGDLYSRFEEGAVGAFGNYQVLLPLSVFVWVFESARLYFVTKSIGVTLSADPMTEVMMVTAVALVASLLTALPLTPAGLGFVESGVVAALLLLGVKDEGLAFSVAFLDRTISYLSLVVFGFVVYLISFRPGSRVAPGAADR
jgi:glycosyltransferase 2 family protein